MRAYKKLANADEMIGYWYIFTVIFAGSMLGFAIRFSDDDGANHPTFWSWVISILFCALLFYPVVPAIKGLAAIAKRVDANAEHIGALDGPGSPGPMHVAPASSVAPPVAAQPLAARAAPPAPSAPPAPAPGPDTVPRASTGVAHTPPAEPPTTPPAPMAGV